MSFVITEPMVRKLLQAVDAGLTAGVGSPEPGKMCVEAAICYALGEPHSDGPSPVAPSVREAKIVLNDCLWSSEKARARGMRRVAIAQLGSKGRIDDTKFSTRVAEYTIRELLPLGLRSAALAHPSKTHRDSLEACAHNCRAAKAARAARAARYASEAASEAASDASEAARYAVRAASEAAKAASKASSDAAKAARYASDAAMADRYASDAAMAARYASDAVRADRYASDAVRADRYAVRAASEAAMAARYASDAAIYAAMAARYASDYASAASKSDSILCLSAELMVRALQECGSPGCDWLWLVDATACSAP